MITYTSLLSYLTGWKRTLTKAILGFHLVFILPSSKYNVNGHENLTTTTFYGHRVKQKTISIRLNFLMPSSWYDVTVHNGLTTTFNHHHIYITQKIRISTYFPTAFFTVLRHSHKCLTTHTHTHVIISFAKPYLRFAYQEWHAINRLDSTGFFKRWSYH